MTLLKSIFLLGAMATAVASHALDVNITAGGLKNAGIPSDESALRIEGTMDASDFAYIFDNLGQLSALDLSGVQIAAYQGDALKYTGMNNSPANTLPAYALTGLVNLKEIKLPASLKAIGKGSLSGAGITELTVPEGVTSIGDYALMRCPNLMRVTIPASVTDIGTRALAYCVKLGEVEISAAITALPEGLFEACGGLKTLSLAGLARCSEIGAWALADCNGVTALVLPDATATIEKAALFGAEGIATIVLPADLTYIGDEAMANMTGLEEINATNVISIPSLGENVWSGVDQSSVKLRTPEGEQDVYKNAAQWQDFDIVKQSSTQNVSSTVGDTGFRVSVNGDELVATSAGDGLGRVSVFDVAGRRIATGEGTAIVKFNVTGWPGGVYLVVSQLGAAKVSL